MRVRTRLILAFAYVLLAVIIALEVPLAVNLEKRALAELKSRSLTQAQSVAAAIGGEGVPDAQQILDRILEPQPGVRVIVVDADGVLVGDSSGDRFLGQTYTTPDRPELVAVQQSRAPVTEIRTSQDLGQDILATAVPILDEGYFGAVRITESMAEVSAAVRRSTWGLIAIGAAALLGGMFVAWLLANSFVRGINKLAAGAERLGRGDLSARVGKVGGGRELDEVGEAFDEMADTVETTMKAERAFVGNASHQLRTPLTGMKLRLEGAMADATDPAVRAQLEAADREVDRLATIVNDLLATSRARESGEPRTTADLADVVERARQRWQERAEAANASMEIGPSGGVVAAGAGDLDQILDNLIDNAISYAPGSLRISTRRSGVSAWILTVEDRGPGIAPDEVDLVTERFYRGRGSTPGGSGLGLAIVRELAERWDGSVAVRSEPGTGTRVEVLLPSV